MPYLLLRGEGFLDAAEAAQRALAAEPESAVNLNNRGIALALAGDADAARDAFL